MGNMVNNPLQDMTREINRMCKPHFMLNVTLNKSKEITEVLPESCLNPMTKGVHSRSSMP